MRTKSQVVDLVVFSQGSTTKMEVKWISKELRSHFCSDEMSERFETSPPFATVNKLFNYMAFFESGEFLYVILELMEGILCEYLQSDLYEPSKSISLCKDIALGLVYLHEQKIIHRDLKPSNVLYKILPKLCLKIADFGLSRREDVNHSFIVMSTSAGTRGWIAPEVVKSLSREHSTASDIFSCGLIFYFVLSPQEHPYNPADCTKKSELEINTELGTNVLKNNMEGWNVSLVPEPTDLIKKMLDIDVKKRPNAQDLTEHPMFWSKKQKMHLLSAVGNQPEFECPRVKRIPPLSAVEHDLESAFATIFSCGTWIHPTYTHMARLLAEMTKPITKMGKKGKTYTVKGRGNYDTVSVVELVRFIRNAMAHVSEASRPSLIRKQILEDSVFLDYFPHLVIEVFKAVTKHGWDAREEIKHALTNEVQKP